MPLVLVAVEAADAVEGGDLVALGEGGVVEDGVDEVLDGAAEGHDGLADVDEFCGAFADDVDAEDLAGVAVEDELEAAGGVAADLASGGFAVVAHADFVGDILVGELLFGFADEADFGDGVDAVGVEAGVGEGAEVAEGAGDGDATLLHGDGGEGGEADDVADGVDAGDAGLEVLVDGDAAAVVGGEAGGVEVKLVDVALVMETGAFALSM